MQVAMVKTTGGALVPMDDCEHQKMRRWKVGGVVRGDFAEMRNGAFFRKFWALMDIAYDLWSDGLGHQEYLGQVVLPEKDRFRKDICVLAGYFRPVFDVHGVMKLEAESIAWSKMTEDRFQSLYSACITVILGKVLAHKNMSETQLRDAVDCVMRFDS